jgi:hypothetical protein
MTISNLDKLIIPIKIVITDFISYFYIEIPQPHKLKTLNLRSSLADVQDISAKIGELLPQISDFISQFNHTIMTNNINVMIDASGSMDIDGPANIPDAELDKIGKRIGILDRLIVTKGEEVSELIKKGLALEANLRKEDINYTSQLVDKINEFKKLSSSYKQ